LGIVFAVNAVMVKQRCPIPEAYHGSYKAGLMFGQDVARALDIALGVNGKLLRMVPAIILDISVRDLVTRQQSRHQARLAHPADGARHLIALNDASAGRFHGMTGGAG
jgi:hypothetical protein